MYNVYGQVVGVVTAKSNEEGAEGLGFAIPIDDAVRIANDVISGERSLDAETGDAYLGITPADVDSMAAQYYGFPEGARRAQRHRGAAPLKRPASRSAISSQSWTSTPWAAAMS